MRATSGPIPQEAQVGLKDTWKAQGLFLACVCRPTEDLDVCEATGGDVESSGVVSAHEVVGDDVVKVVVRPQHAIGYRAGQFMHIVRPGDRLSRPYSIASTTPDALEFHIRRVADGRMSGWLCDEARVGERVSLRGPSGSCFYVADPEQPLLLIGTSTGLAPILGVARDAIAHGHRGPIALYHGSARAQGLYLGDELEALAREPNVSVARYVLGGPAPKGAIVGAIEDDVLARDDLASAKAWVCGAPSFVSGLKRKLFLAGMALGDISSDAFVMTPS